MGRGHAYSYDYFMLIDDDQFTYQPTDEEGEDVGDPVWDDYSWDMFKRDAVGVFGGDIHGRNVWTGRESCYVGGTGRLHIGIDNSGGCPCVFVVPKCYNPFGEGNREEKEYDIQMEVARAFNKLTKLYPTLFSYPTSAWTSSRYGKWYQKRERKVAA